jgi:CRISPR-associated protein Csx3
LLGVRETFGDVVFDPVLPRGLDGLIAELTLLGRAVEARYRVRQAGFGPTAVVVNGVPLAPPTRDSHPYRVGGWRVSSADLLPLLGHERNVLEFSL